MSKKIFIALVIISLFLPVYSAFAEPLVNCGTGNDQKAALDCNFSKLMEMINIIINYLIMIALPLAAISFAYAGWLYLAAGDSSSNVSKAKTIFADVGIGLVLVLSSWLIFKLIETTFLNKSAGYDTYLK